MANVKTFLALTTFFAVFLMFSGAVSAANVTINPGDSIQSAIDNASDNDTIIVNDNNGSAYTYTENVVINKTVSLKAKTGGNVTVQARNSSRPVFTVTSLGNGTTIQGFTIIGAANSNGIYLNGASNCIITGNTVINNTNGLYLLSSNNNEIQGNNLTNTYGIVFFWFKL